MIFTDPFIFLLLIIILLASLIFLHGFNSIIVIAL
jgi:hypothetical protein